MPQFSSPFSGSASAKKLTHAELVRAVRFMEAAEYEATQMYMQPAESTDNRLAVKVLKDVADDRSDRRRGATLTDSGLPGLLRTRHRPAGSIRLVEPVPVFFGHRSDTSRRRLGEILHESPPHA